MKEVGSVLSALRPLTFLSVLMMAAFPASGAIRTNWVDRWITNSVDVYVPANRFVTEYHTNLIVRAQTNIVDVYSTNVVIKRLTNHVAVNLVQTNFVQAYRTNYKDLHVTNWTTVLVLKTNYVQQTVTNVAVVEIPRAEPEERPAEKGAAVLPAKLLSTAATPTIEVTRGLRQTPANMADVRLNVRWAAQGHSRVQVRQWKVQSEDGSVLCFGQDLEFRRNLPFGHYSVEVKAQQDTQTPVVSLRGILAVSSREVRLIQQKMLARK